MEQPTGKTRDTPPPGDFPPDRTQGKFPTKGGRPPGASPTSRRNRPFPPPKGAKGKADTSKSAAGRPGVIDTKTLASMRDSLK